MSTLQVPVARIDDISQHSNADNLEIAIILGWQCIVQKGTHKPGDVVVYIPPDTLMPEFLSDQLHVTQYLSKQRVRAVKLRGESSYGLTIPIPEGKDWQLGDNVAQYFGLKKYYPPVRQSADDSIPEHPLFYRYTEIENLRNYPHVFSDPDERIIITEKIHGSSVRIGVINGETMAGSRKLQRKETANSMFWFPSTLPSVDSLLRALKQDHNQVILYGEIFGNRIQAFDYGSPNDMQFRAFDLLLDGKYVDFDAFSVLMRQYGIPTVPVLYDGEYININTVKNHAVGKTTIGGNNVLEGVVVKPAVERHDAKIGRVVLKYINDEYLQLKEKKDIDSTDQ